MLPVGSVLRSRWSSAVVRQLECRSASHKPTADPSSSSSLATSSINSSSSDTPSTASSSSASLPLAPGPDVPDAPAVSASSHLFALAAEEALHRPAPPTRAPNPLLRPLESDAPWTGDEPIESTVLRMLIDKHKPHRTGTIKSSDDRIREEVQKSALERMMDEEKGLGRAGTGGAVVLGGGGTDEGYLTRKPTIKKTTRVWDGHLVGGDPNHQPWMSEYATPHATNTPFIRRGHLIAKSSKGVKQDAASRSAMRRQRALNEGPVRAGNARERALDFQLDKIAVSRAGGAPRRRIGGMDQIDENLDVRVVMTPADYRIEQARLEGAFDNLPGRGKPLAATHTETSNPYVGRSEFFMNRIFQRNDVLPVWIDLQKQHALALENFRASLVSMLHRRLLHHPRLPPYASSAQIEGLRVKELEVGGVERTFWEGLVKEVNNKGRSADGVAPPSTRKGTTSFEIELARAYPKAVLEVHKSIHAPQPEAPALNQIDVDKIEWGMDWRWLEKFALWRWWMSLRGRRV